MPYHHIKVLAKPGPRNRNMHLYCIQVNIPDRVVRLSNGVAIHNDGGRPAYQDSILFLRKAGEVVKTLPMSEWLRVKEAIIEFNASSLRGCR